MSSLSLPTAQQLQAVADADADQCQDLVLQAVIYGTEALEPSSALSLSLEERTKEACKVLADAWEDCLALENALVDALWLRGSMVDRTKEGDASSPFQALVEILKILVQIPDRQSFWTKLQGNLMPSLIDAVGLASEQDLLKRLKQHNTQIHYKQQKYNLLQEESEGYSKILQFLVSGNSPKNSDLNNANLEEERRSQLHKLLGTFELDPNRVLDLAIDVLEAQLYPNGCSEELLVASNKPERTSHCTWLLGLMKEFCLDKLPSLLYFKLSSGDNKVPSPSLLRTIALLASHDLLDLKLLVQDYFGPLESEIEQAHKVLWMKEKRRIQALMRVSLSGTTKVDPKQAELAERLEKCRGPLEKNQMLKLLLVLLEWGEWGRAKPLLPIRVWGQLCTLLPETFGSALCDVAQERLDLWYQSKVGIPGLSKPWTTPDEDVVMSDDSPDLTIDDVVRAVANPLLCTVHSASIALRPALFCQICRVFRSLLKDDDSEHHVSDETYNFFKTFLVPSLSLFPANPAISAELWNVLKCLPYATRYRLYADWRGAGLERAGLSSSSGSGKSLRNVESEVEAGKATRYALKRLSMENIRDMSRQLAKVTHSNPLVVFATILNQIESYDNMVEVMVEAQRYVNPLGLDVLGYCILTQLSGVSGGVKRSPLKEDGVNVSQWLQSLEAFSGAFFKRYPYVEFRGILSYLMRQLREGDVMELGILRTLLKVTGGYSFADYSPAASLSSAQLEGRAGSITLKRETISFGIVEDTNARASERIRHVLQTDGFGVTMLILIAQVRARILFESTRGAPKPVKLIGNLFDSSQVVLSILLEFLTNEEDAETRDSKTSGSIMKYAEYLPKLEELHSNFGLDPVSSWMLCRPLVQAAVLVHDSTEAENSTDGKKNEELKRFSVTEEFRKSYESMLPEEIWSVLAPELFELFYTKGVYNLFCPEDAYSTETARVTKEIERVEQRLKGGTTTTMQVGPNPQKNESEELERLKKVLRVLTADLEKQTEHVTAVHKDMEQKKSNLFKSAEVSRDSASAFLVHCVYPRSMQSPDDATYCAHFAFQLHKQQTPGFGTLHYIDGLISVVAGSLFGVTEGEAANLAILLWETWKVVNKWRYEEGLFDAEVSGRPGSFMEVVDGDNSSEPRAVSRKDFETLYNTWHASLGAALIGCLNSSEYMHTRAGLLVLTRIVEVFPTRPKFGNKLLRVLAPLQDDSRSRLDIRASANAYGTMLLKARDDGKWVEEDASVAKARADKVKAAAEARKQKQKEIFQELERDSERITGEIGPRDGPNRDRFDRRRGVPRGSGPVESDKGRGQENGEVPTRDRRDPDRRGGGEAARGSSPTREADRRRERERGEERGQGRPDVVGSPPGRPGDRQHSSDTWRRDGAAESHRGGREESKAVSGRRTRGEPAADGRGGRNSKRSRPSSPEPGAESRGNAKRPRLAQEAESNYEGRRDIRGSSPQRRRSPPAARSRGSRRSGRR